MNYSIIFLIITVTSLEDVCNACEVVKSSFYGLNWRVCIHKFKLELTFPLFGTLHKIQELSTERYYKMPNDFALNVLFCKSFHMERVFKPNWENQSCDDNTAESEKY